VLDDVNDNVETTIISHRNGGDAVVMSLQHYNLMMETIHLISSPANASRLMGSIAQVNTGKITQRDLIDDLATDLDR
jgi:antitoxin YefM